MFPKSDEHACGIHFPVVLFGSKTIGALVGNISALVGNSHQDLVFFRVVYNVPSCVCLSILWLGSRGLGTLVFLSSPFLCSLPFASTFPKKRRQKV
jgi:hypothetical protein